MRDVPWAIFDCESSFHFQFFCCWHCWQRCGVIWQRGILVQEWSKVMISGAVIRRQYVDYVRRPTTTQQQQWPSMISISVQSAMYKQLACTECLLHWLVMRMTIQQSNILPDLRTWWSLDDLVQVPLLCIGDDIASEVTH